MGDATAPPRRPLPEPALPWTENHLAWTSPTVRKRVLVAWESLPRWPDLKAPRSYLRGLRIHRELFVGDYTMVYPVRGRTLYRLARHADRDHLEGALVDCGTYSGGSTALLSAGSRRRDVWAFDSFEGLPPPSERDTNDPNFDQHAAGEYFAGECLGSEDRLREAVARYGSPDRLHVRKGWFDDTLPIAREEIGPIAVLHIDGDWYDSVYCVLENLYDLVVPGGAIAIDDYGGVPGAGRATVDWRDKVGDTAPLHRVDQTGRYWKKGTRAAA